ncbi:MAG: amidohydrolase family protein [Acidimicrobiia bacterium]|nr:amidohydrolase family protein [Acidimicrobiia bacterium]
MSQEHSSADGISRRDLLKSGAALGAAAALVGPTGVAAAAQTGRGSRSSNGRDLVFINGAIHTMDAAGTVARSIVIRDGRIVSVGQSNPVGGPGAQVVNLRGRTVLPGLIESHTHFVSLANRPGYHVAELELASSIAEVQAMLAGRRAVGDIPDGGFITGMGGWHPRMWAESRLPTLEELDEAVSD